MAGESPRIDVIVASLQGLGSQWDRSMLFKKHTFGYLVVDEAHNLKNSESQLYRCIKKSISSTRRLFLTGSPIQNELSELQNLLLLLLPTSLSTRTVSLAVQAFAAQHKRLQEEQRAEQQGAGSQARADGEAPSAKSATTKKKGNQADTSHIGLNDLPVLAAVLFLQQIFSPFILRRLKSEVINDLPTKLNIVERCTMTGRQRDLYHKEIEAADSELARNLCFLSVSKLSLGEIESAPAPLTDNAADKPIVKAGGRNKKSTSLNKQYIQNLMFRLRRICNHPILFKGYYTAQQVEAVMKHYHTHVEGFKEQPWERVKSEISNWSDYELHQAVGDPFIAKYLPGMRIPDSELLASAKIVRLLELVDEVKNRCSKALIFSQFTTYLDVIEEILMTHRPGVHFFRLDGKTAVADRQTIVTRFGTDPDVTLFLLSTKAGAVGLNLTAADTVLLMDQNISLALVMILCDQDWNPHTDRQAEDRAHRLGQQRPVTVHRLCCRGSLEESILRCAEKKLWLDEQFGGNADLLSAAILKDCISIAAKDDAEGEEEQQHAQQETENHKPAVGDSIPRKVKKQSAPTSELKNPVTNARKRVTKKETKAAEVPSVARVKKKADNLSTTDDKVNTVNGRGKDSNLSRKGKPEDENNRRDSENREPEKTSNAVCLTPRRDALMNRFGGRFGSSSAGARKRRREDELDENTKKQNSRET